MKNAFLYITIILSMGIVISCSVKENDTMSETPVLIEEEVKVQQHQYGGWYCPDNLFGFPATNISDWKNVPVVNGRMPTQEETQSEASLIFVDQEIYPNSNIIDMKMPRLAKYYNRYSKREDLVIIIQAIQINEDSVVGFRFLNGGNGSARLSEVDILSDEETKIISTTKFVAKSMELKASPKMVWDIMTKSENLFVFDDILNSNGIVTGWRSKTNVNFNYPEKGQLTASFGDKLFGNYYIQNDYSNGNYTEKFFIVEYEDKNTVELKVVCGPFGDDYESQDKIINSWMNEIKKMSEL